MNVLKGTDKTTSGLIENFLSGILTKEITDEEIPDEEPVLYTLTDGEPEKPEE